MLTSLGSIRNVVHKWKATEPLLKTNPAEWLAELATRSSELPSLEVQLQRTTYWAIK